MKFALPFHCAAAMAGLLLAAPAGATPGGLPWPLAYPYGARPQPAAQPQGQNSEPGAGYWTSPRYRPLQQRPGLPPNSSGTPGSYSYRSPDGRYSYSIQRTPNGYSYSYHLHRGGPPAGTAPTPAWSQTQAAPASQTGAAPWLEAGLNERRPFVQQNLIYRLRIHGSGNLAEASPEIPQLESVVFRQLAQPTTYRSGDDVVTEYDYLVVPLQAGTLQLPAPRVSGRYRDGTPFEVTGDHPMVLYVQPPHEGVTPWLPLDDLRLEMHLPEPVRARAGEPLSLEIVTTAVGAVGSQLPSVAEQLKSDDFYIYPGEVREEGHISSDGLDLLGSRVERFTLVPRWGGRLTLPALSLSWWNLRTGQPAVTRLPMRHIEVTGPVAQRPDTRKSWQLALSPYFWIPLALVGLLLAVGWLKVLFGRGHRPGESWLGRRLQGVLGGIQGPLAGALRQLSPLPHLHRLRSWIGRRLPVSWKLWYCLRAVDREEDPQAWEHALQILAAKHLGARPHAGLQELAGVITACHPSANAAEVHRLLEQLERANYGGQTIEAFHRWKAAFKRQIQPRLFSLRVRRCRPQRRRTGLPDLNPGA